MVWAQAGSSMQGSPKPNPPLWVNFTSLALFTSELDKDAGNGHWAFKLGHNRPERNSVM
jgi:hypothetical protein